MALRLALGAGRGRLIRLLLTESLILACLGGLGGIAVGYGGIAFLRTFRIPAELPVTIPFRMDGRMLVASLVVSVVSALLCGIVPALRSTRADLVDGLKTADVDMPGRPRLWGRSALVVAQVSMSLMLMTAAFLMARSFQRSVAEGTGFVRDRLLLVRFDPRIVQYDAAQAQQFYTLLTERVRATAGVQSAALMEHPPLGLDDFDRIAFVPDGFQMPRDRENLTSMIDTVDEGYFETIGIPMVYGRGFRTSDRVDAPHVAVVNEHFANHYWPGANAVGRHIRLDGPTGALVEIVGVAQTIKYTSGASGRSIDFVYLPLAQHPVSRMVLLVRSSGDPLQLVDSVKDVVRTLNPNLPMLETRSYEDLYRYAAVEGPRVAIELVGAMGAVGLVLTVTGSALRIGGVHGEPEDARDRHSHRPRRRERRRAAPGDGEGPHARRDRDRRRVRDGLRRRTPDECHGLRRRSDRRRGLSDRRAVDGGGDAAGDLRARATGRPNCADRRAPARVDPPTRPPTRARAAHMCARPSHSRLR